MFEVEYELVQHQYESDVVRNGNGPVVGPQPRRPRKRQTPSYPPLPDDTSHRMLLTQALQFKRDCDLR